MNLSDIPSVSTLIDLAIEEDLGRGDATTDSTVPAETAGEAIVIARADLVVAGVDVAAAVFQRISSELEIEASCKDGANCKSGDRILKVSGPARAILKGERTALNFLQRLSGVATLSAQFAEAVSGTSARVVDTRKTIPGYRLLAKHAVRVGGCGNHRADLASGILIKDNHIAAAGSVRAAVSGARKFAPHSLRIEVEVDTFEQLEEAIAIGVDVVLLDNMSPEEVKRCSEVAKKAKVLVEVSGGITLATVLDYANAGADFISAGALTHSAPAVDLALDWVK